MKHLLIRYNSKVEFNLIKDTLEESGEDVGFLNYSPNNNLIQWSESMKSWITVYGWSEKAIDWEELEIFKTK